jgi:hypothetical protein
MPEIKTLEGHVKRLDSQFFYTGLIWQIFYYGYYGTDEEVWQDKLTTMILVSKVSWCIWAPKFDHLLKNMGIQNWFRKFFWQTK